MAASFDGFIYSSTDPTGGTEAWKLVDVDGEGRDTHLEAISCASPSLCVAVSGDRFTSGKVLSSTNPTGGKAAWQVLQLDESLDLRSVACPTPSLCLAAGQGGKVIVSTNPTGGPAAWRELPSPGGPGNIQGGSCASTELCAFGNAGGNVIASTNPGAGAPDWRTGNAGHSVQITGVSCPFPSGCATVDNNGDVAVSHNPAGPSASWDSQNLVPFQPPSGVEQPENALFAVSCPSASLCTLVGANGRIFTSSDLFAPSQEPAKKRRRHRPMRPRTTLVREDGFRNMTRRRAKGIKVGFRFFAKRGARRFICKRDRHAWRPCHSPFRCWATLGHHTFRVRAIGFTGLKGPIALDRFRVIPNPAFISRRPPKGSRPG